MCPDNVVGHRESLYRLTFSTIYPFGFGQQTQQSGAHGEDLFPKELTDSSLSIQAPQSPTLCLFQRKDTVEVFVPSLNKPLIAVYSQGFFE